MFYNKEYVYEVYKELSFSKAAKNLFIAQPSLSASIKKIENKIGMPLFDRSSNPIRLTECGEKYISCVERIMDIERDFADTLGDMTSINSGHISIGASQFFISFILPNIIDNFRKSHPLIGFSVSEADSAALEQQLLTGNLDFVIDNNIFNNAHCDATLIGLEHLLFIVPISSKCNEGMGKYRITAEQVRQNVHLSGTIAPVPLNKFCDENYILLGQNNASRKISDILFNINNFSPKAFLQLEQQFTAFLLAKSGIGAAFVSDTLIKQLYTDNSLAIYTLPPDISQLRLYCYCKKNRYITNAMRLFSELLSHKIP